MANKNNKRILSELVDESETPKDTIILQLAMNGLFEQYVSEIKTPNKKLLEPSISEDEFNKIINPDKKSKKTKKEED